MDNPSCYPRNPRREYWNSRTCRAACDAARHRRRRSNKPVNHVKPVSCKSKSLLTTTLPAPLSLFLLNPPPFSLSLLICHHQHLPPTSPPQLLLSPSISGFSRGLTLNLKTPLLNPQPLLLRFPSPQRRAAGLNCCSASNLLLFPNHQ